MYQSAVKESKIVFFIEDSKFENKHVVSRSLRFVSSICFDTSRKSHVVMD